VTHKAPLSILTITQMNELQLSEHEYRWAYSAIDEVLPTDVHMAMVIPALEYQTSPEQRDRWLPLAKSFKILGAYVQTELGHGSNVRALETTATYDVATKEWVLHSPTLTSTKWWPGGLGKTATHAVRAVLVAAATLLYIMLIELCSVDVRWQITRLYQCTHVCVKHCCVDIKTTSCVYVTCALWLLLKH
jgi:Acyl-coenzyme A oxidase N-terminal